MPKLITAPCSSGSVANGRPFIRLFVHGPLAADPADQYGPSAYAVYIGRLDHPASPRTSVRHDNEACLVGKFGDAFYTGLTQVCGNRLPQVRDVVCVMGDAVNLSKPGTVNVSCGDAFEYGVSEGGHHRRGPACGKPLQRVRT
jgi:hypothetical protein